MYIDRESRGGQVPLPGFSDCAPAGRTTPAREDGIRRLRRMSNWSVAALIVGTGAATGALAHAFPAATPATTAATAAATTTGAGAAVTVQGTRPRVSQPVAVSSGSGVVAAGGVPAAAGTGTAASATSGAAPQVRHTVATSSGSGVTTTTRTVNGKIITSVQRVTEQDD